MEVLKNKLRQQIEKNETKIQAEALRFWETDLVKSEVKSECSCSEKMILEEYKTKRQMEDEKFTEEMQQHCENLRRFASRRKAEEEKKDGGGEDIC